MTEVLTILFIAAGLYLIVRAVDIVLTACNDFQRKADAVKRDIMGRSKISTDDASNR